jgi:hypothetical protein
MGSIRRQASAHRLLLVKTRRPTARSNSSPGPDLVTETGAELAGFEAWRSSVYGSAVVRQRGSRFLPQLAIADLVVETDDRSSRFATEVERLRAGLEPLRR